MQTRTSVLEFNDTIILSLVTLASAVIGWFAKILTEKIKSQSPLDQAKAAAILYKEALALLEAMRKQKNCQIDNLNKEIKKKDIIISELEAVIRSDTIFKDVRKK